MVGCLLNNSRGRTGAIDDQQHDPARATSLQDVENTRRLLSEEMSWASDQVELWMSECVQDENVDPDLASWPTVLHKRLRVTRPQQRYTAQRRVTERVSKMTGVRARGRGRIRGRQQSASGSGRRAHTMVPTSTNPGRPQDDLPEDDTTPKARSAGAKRFAADFGENTSQGSDSPSKRSRSTTSRGSRTSSPSKPNILRSLQHPIRNKSLDGTNLPNHARQLVRQVRRFAAGFETVPQELRASLEETYTEDLDLTQNVVYTPDSERAKLGNDLAIREVACICRQARGCQQRNENEAAWNSHVHGPILSLVGELSCHRSQIGSTNVTTARLNPRFKPAIELTQPPLSGKVIDFVFFLEPSVVIERAFGDLPWETNHGHDFNHTLYGPIANRPIAISMETKREGEGQATGRAQLEIWVAAHFNRLQEIICDGAEELPILPLLLTQGPVWSLLFADRQREGQAWVTIIYEKVTLGDVTTPSGVFKVVSSLLLLMHWAQTDFRLWFERMCTASAA
ncbi:hypothetical protein LTR56_027570 [Elasticomyces elasticus]|nr:hypothetical protein LTR56_027570 [Elasticomyces elasticus]